MLKAAGLQVALCARAPVLAPLRIVARASSTSTSSRSSSVTGRRPAAAAAAPGRRAAAAAAGARVVPRAAAGTAGPQKVTGEELEKLLADGEVRKVPVIIDLFATWCGPCLLLAEELDKVAKELGPEGVRIFKVDVDVEQALASQLQVQALPTLIMIGTDLTKPALRAEGLLTAKKIIEIVKTELH